MTDAAIQNLLRDHAAAEKMIAEMESLLPALRSQPEWNGVNQARYERFAQFFLRDCITHMRKEDEVLYPALEAFLPREVGPLMVLRTEHSEMTSNFSRLQKAAELLASGSATPELSQKFLYYLRTIVQTMRDHIYKEQHMLFPMVARFLTPEQDQRLAAEMQAIDDAKNQATLGRVG